MRQDKKRRLTNLKVLTGLKSAVSQALLKPSLENLKAASSAIDRAAKKRVIHQNKANRLKSRLAKKITLAKESKKPLNKTRGKKKARA
jgi:small subunit ribosomal protein S20